jgi:glyoxylase-like metal-dependent hydrolase (beta-lactamase superfamily II)
MAPTPEIETFFDPVTSTLSYLVYDRISRDAVVIDPVLDYEPESGRVTTVFVDKVAARIRGAELTRHYVLETHAHADHLSGSQQLKRLFGAKVAIHERICEVQATFKKLLGLPSTFPTDGSQFDRLLSDGEILRAGSLAIEVIATPGHTPACVTYRIADTIFTGDALFIEDSGTGRCDFPAGSADALYRSVHDRLYALPAETRVFVGHDYQPGGRDLIYATTIGRERNANIQLRAATTHDEYVAFRRARDRTLASPRLLWPSLQVNIDAGRLPEADEHGRRYLKIPIRMDDAA